MGANLRYTNLSKADLEVANLKDSSLRHTDLMGANLRYANLHSVLFPEKHVNLLDEYQKGQVVLI